MRELEIEGKTVTIAVEKGLSELGLRRDQVEVEVLQEASPGFLGIGAKQARVRLREKIWGEPAGPQPSAGKRQEAPRRARQAMPKNAPARLPAATPATRPPTRAAAPAPSGGHARPPVARPLAARPPEREAPPPDPDKACAEVKPLLQELLSLMGVGASSISSEWDAKQERVRADIETPDGDALVGKEGKTLEALQFLATLMLGRRLKTPVAVQVEHAGYWRQREEDILLQVHQAMEMLSRTGQPVRLNPMEAPMRRLIHRTLANHPEIETVSEGEGPWRKVVLKRRRR